VAIREETWDASTPSDGALVKGGEGSDGKWGEGSTGGSTGGSAGGSTGGSFDEEEEEEVVDLFCIMHRTNEQVCASVLSYLAVLELEVQSSCFDKGNADLVRTGGSESSGVETKQATDPFTHNSAGISMATAGTLTIHSLNP
jgi:hypothetical protein